MENNIKKMQTDQTLIYKPNSGAPTRMTVFEAIALAMLEINPVGKNQTNEKQRFKYRGIDDVYNSLHPILAKWGLFSAPEVLEEKTEERISKSGSNLIYRVLKIKFTMYASDGSSISGIVIGEGMDSGDKAANKAMAVAHKYFLSQLFAIPTSETTDPDKTSYEVKPKISKQDVTKPEKVVTSQKQSVTNKGDIPEKCPKCDENLGKAKKPDKNGMEYYYCWGYKKGCKYRYYPDLMVPIPEKPSSNEEPF